MGVEKGWLKKSSQKLGSTEKEILQQLGINEIIKETMNTNGWTNIWDQLTVKMILTNQIAFFIRNYCKSNRLS